MVLKNLNHQVDKKLVCFISLSTVACIGIAIVAEFLVFNKLIPHRGDFYFSWSRFLSIAVICLLAVLLVKFHHYFLKHLEHAFLIIAIPMGILFIFVLPKTVHVSYDDQIHLRQAYVLFSKSDVKWSKAFRMLESSTTKVDDLTFAEIDAVYDQLNAAHEETKDQQANFGDNSLSFTRLVYLPYFVGFKVSEFLHLNFTTMITVAKFCNFFCYVFLLFFAIKVSTHTKKIFFVLAVFLSNIFYASQFSYDPTITASIMLAIALFLRMLELDNIPPRYIIAFALASAWGSLPKAIYCPVLLLLLFVPNKNFGDRRRAVACKIAVVILTILLASTFVLPMLSGGMGADFRGGDTSVGRQIAYILQNPLHFLVTFGKFTVNNLPGLILAQPTSVGIYLPYNYTHYVLPLINLAYVVLLGYVIFTSCKSSKVYTWPVRIAILLVYLLIVYSAIGAMYLSFTPVGANTIEGFQERYLLPILPLALIFLVPTTNSNVKIRAEKTNFAILAVPFLSLAVFLLCFILRVSIV